jgi:hypothetical protein
MKIPMKKPHGSLPLNMIMTPGSSQTFTCLIQEIQVLWPADAFFFIRIDNKQQNNNITKEKKKKKKTTKATKQSMLLCYFSTSHPLF